jgi:hypothetical protein
MSGSVQPFPAGAPGAPAGVIDTSVPYNRPVWPVILGVVSIVQAGYALVRLVTMLLNMAYSVVLQGTFSGAFPLGGMGLWNLVQAAQYLLPPLLGVLLLAAGVLLYRHYPLAPLLHVIYAVPTVLLSAGLPVAFVLTCPPQFMPHMAFPTLQNATVSLIYPVFLLVWFARAKIRRQVAMWGP